MWKIKHIFDGDYGCEALAPGEKPKVSVTIVNDVGEEKIISVEDDWLTENSLDVGSEWLESSDKMGVDMVKEIIFSGEPYGMNWLRKDFVYGEVLCPPGLEAVSESVWEGETLTTEFLIKNVTEKPVFTSLSDIGLRLPLQDRYEDSDTCIRKRCHTHIFCGKDISYVYALRMGGEAPHFGLVVTEGSFGGYSIERDLSKMSNDRGCFILHPCPDVWQPGEEKRLVWKIFSHAGEEDFFHKAGMLRPFVRVEASGYVLFPGEECVLHVTPSFEAKRITVDGEVYSPEEGWHFTYDNSVTPGDRIFKVCADGIQTTCRIYLHANPNQLAENRCRYIVEKQQYRGEKPEGLDGAYLIYDTEEEHTYYTARNDDNAGRERVGMGLLISAWLQENKDVRGQEKCEEKLKLTEKVERSRQRYMDFVLRELVDEQTGEVFNDFGRDNSYERLYNMPWYATLMVEQYKLTGEKEYLEIACRILKAFYKKGGYVHYAIEIPILSLCHALKDAGLLTELDVMTGLFRNHGDAIAELGTHYPPFEVNYEQSIVAPAANILLQLYLLTREEKYLEAGKKQLQVLELFNGHQPDYHLYETAIRHWDGYWFGKNRMYGDTFPHYWSGLTGSCFALMYVITGEKRYAKRAKDSLRGILPMIFPDGRASCAFLFPVTVNGKKCSGYDPYANDQDWALYFYLRTSAIGICR